MSTPIIPYRWVGWILALVTTLLVVRNQEEVGIARDEVVYMQYGSKYAKWWGGYLTGEPATRQQIAKSWGGPGSTDNNREHPPLMKTLSGISHAVLSDKLGVMDDVTAYRLPSAMMHGLLVLLVFLMVLEIWGFAEALVSGLLVMLLPRALFHAGLACFDAPIATLWFATVYAYWKALDGRKWPWLVGAVFGLALATKHTALLLPFALGLHYLAVGIRENGRRFLLYRWRVIVSMLVLSPLVFIALWPWLWFDTIPHVRDWLKFHLEHTHYNFEYLGDNWNAPPFPWHVAPVTTFFTVPAATLAAAVAGAGAWLVQRREIGDRRLPGLLLALSAAASIGPFLLGSTPIFGAEKHWMPALPSICIAAGIGTVWAGRAIALLVPAGGSRNLAIRRGVVGVACAAVVLASAVETITAQPYALTWYNALAGEAPGGADLGMNRQFWGVAARGVLPVLAAEAPKQRSPVYTHDASPAWGYYLRRGDIPPTLPDAGHEESGINASKYALVIHEKHFVRHDYLIWKTYGTVQPMFVLRTHGVPIVSLYKRPRRQPQ